MLPELVIGFGLGIAIAMLAWRAGALSASGAVAAAVTGGLIFGLGGARWAVLLLLFFFTSSGLSQLFGRQKSKLAEKFSKGSRRDWAQVCANGGLGALLAVGHGFWPEQAWIWVAYAGAMAGVNADTWSTELGVLSRTPPRLITTGKIVERGESGGVSLMGTLAALGGAGIIGAGAAALAPEQGVWSLLAATSLGGLTGSLFDSLLGATLQAIYYCPTCQKETERHPRHTCGDQTTLQRGWRWLNNDLVNLACSIAGGGLAVVIWALVS
jgi:uncharacterized protein (TIGR00297 family)